MVLMKSCGSSSSSVSALTVASPVRLSETAMGRSFKWMTSLFKHQHKGNIVKQQQQQQQQPKGLIDWKMKTGTEFISLVEGVDIHYTSLRDIIPAMLMECKQDEIVCCGSPRTRMKNHLVEQAARAYLQPSALEYNKSTQFFPWNWQKLMGYTPLTFTSPFRSCMAFFSSLSNLSLSQALRHLLGRLRPHPGLRLC